MCDTCGCAVPLSHTIAVNEPLLAANAAAAEHVRAHFAARRILAINLMGAPGAGKTALLEAAIRNRRDFAQIAVIEGDQATDRDSARIRALGVIAHQVQTGLGCHLEAAQIQGALRHLSLANGGVLFIENVGNLVCPALFDLGENLRVVVTSPTEGVDKPLKYPPMFRAAHVVVLSKCDLLPHLPFNLEEWTDYLFAVNPHARIVRTSAVSGDGIDAWLSVLDLLRPASPGAARSSD